MKRILSLFLAVALIICFTPVIPLQICAVINDNCEEYLVWEVVNDQVFITDCDESLETATWHYAAPMVCEYLEKGKNTAVQFESLEEALSVATKGTIKLLADVTMDSVKLKTGLLLDLNGYTLNAKSVSGKLTDTQDSGGYYTYNVFNGRAKIALCDPSISGDIIIPSTFGRFPVTGIDEWAFSYCESLTSVEIPDSVYTISDAAFLGCSGLTSIVIPDSVTSIGREAFYDCSSLVSIEIPENVTTISEYMFENCSSLESVILLEGVTQIGEGAFCNCSSLTSIEIPKSITSVGDYAFYDCSSLTDVNYGRTEEYRSNITIGSDNEPLQTATWHYTILMECEYLEAGNDVAIQFESLEKALEVATNGTIKLLEDVTTGAVMLKPGLTLDLNQRALTAEVLIVLDGATILDDGAACTGGGKLVVAEKNLVFARQNGQGVIPVWNGTDGYVFTKVSFQQLVQTAGEGEAQYIFLPQFSNRNASSLMKNGGTDNGVKIKVCLTWGDGQSQQYYTYSDDLVEKVFDGTGRWVFSLNVTGISGITDMAASAMIVTDTYAQVSATATGLTAG